MKITYYTNGKSEILVIKDNYGKIIKKGLYNTGNCLVDILFSKAIVCDNKIIDIDTDLKNKITCLLERCSDYLSNDIKIIIEKEIGFIFDNQFLYQNIFIGNKLCRIHFFEDIQSLVYLLLTNIYTNKLMYKHCAYCKRLFATRHSRSKFCKRIATKGGKTCSYASRLKSMEVQNDK